MSTIQSGFSKKTLVAGRGLFEQAILDALVARGSQLKAGAGGFVRSLAKRWPAIVAAMVLAVGVGPTFAEGDDDETPLGAATLIIELTDNDIELQAFIDGSPAWKRFEISDPRERKIFDMRTKKRLRMQGMSELFFASSPDHFEQDAPSESANETVKKFLRKFPAGAYEFEAKKIDGGELEGEAVLTHVLAALPEIITPVSYDDEPPVVDPLNLVIEWEPVTTRFIGDGPVTIIEYQVILDQVDPLREMAWVDGKTRRSLINLPGTVTSLTVPPEFLLRGATYDFEVIAIEESGNATISVGEFITSE